MALERVMQVSESVDWFITWRHNHLLLLGIDPFIVMVQGHWKSDAFLSYWKH